ncbi:MAG TPA: hypothetical protein VFT72_08000 [Opitutaceae bacterium]|nr:hypothetical protein [Opitutaceae bacterium]
MKKFFRGILFTASTAFAAALLSSNTAYCAKVGDTLEQVLAEKGPPKSQMTAGETRVLTYPDMTVKLKSDVVVSISPVASSSGAHSAAASSNGTATSDSASSAAPSSTGATAAQDKVAASTVERRLRRAIEIVQNIVNQPVEAIPIKPGMRVTSYGDYWFHEGAMRPDFAHVDVRKTQESSYSQFQYVTSKLNPGVAFEGPGLEFNSMLKLFYLDRNLPKKRLTEREMLEINQQYRIIAECQAQLAALNQARK